MVCLDSSFIIDIINGAEKAKQIEKEIDESNYDMTISSPAIVEVIRGLYLESTSKNIKPKEEEKTFELINSLAVLDLDKDSAVLAGRIEAELRNKGVILDIEDIMIAAICIKNNETLVTRNKKHFERISGLEIETY